MPDSVVITGIGMVTPLGSDPAEVLRRVEARESAAVPADFDASLFACRICAPVRDFRVQDYTVETKMVRLMNRDAQLAVGAAHLALQGARLRVGVDYRPEEIALFGATGLAGLPLSEVAPLIRQSVGVDAQFDLGRFGQHGLRSISPLLSFKVLGNMPVCFVSICENVQGANTIYTPWEGQGAQAIAAGLRALQQGQARCALVGGCDVKTHELAFIALEQLGLFQTWKDRGAGLVPGEGAVFLVLEWEENAGQRGAPLYARMAGVGLATCRRGVSPTVAYVEALNNLAQGLIPAGGNPAVPLAPGENQGQKPGERRRSDGCEALGMAISPQQAAPLAPGAIIAGADGDDASRGQELEALSALQISAETVLYPKPQVGNLFAAAAALQVGLGAVLAGRLRRSVLANCFGYGSEQAAFLLEHP